MTGTILLVDNNPLQAASKLALLREHFATVYRAADAVEALCMVEQSEISNTLGLILISLPVMGIGCVDLTTELLERLPDTPILLINGAAGTEPLFHHLPVHFHAAPVPGEELIALITHIRDTHRVR